MLNGLRWQPVTFFVRFCLSKVRYCILIVLYRLHLQKQLRSDGQASSLIVDTLFNLTILNIVLSLSGLYLRIYYDF